MIPDRIARICRALASKTVENGCTEEEALDAARKLAELLAEYNLTLDEVQLRRQPFDRQATHFERDPVAERLWKVAGGIAHMTGSRYWRGAGSSTVETIEFFGFEHEVEVSRYLLALCAGAMRRELRRLKKAYALLVPNARRRKILPFLDGMADRLFERLWEMKPKEPTGKGLVVLRDSLIVQALKDAGIETKSSAARRSLELEPNYHAGRAAGERVAIHAGVEGSTERKAIE